MKADLGEPDLRIGPLVVWIHGRQFPSASDYWDGNWLRATAHCGSGGAEVTTSGSILHVPELLGWLNACESLNRDLTGEANLETIEPMLKVRLAGKSQGHLRLEVEITPDNVTQSHWFAVDLDQSYLSPLIAQLRRVLEAFPVRGELSEHAT